MLSTEFVLLVGADSLVVGIAGEDWASWVKPEDEFFGDGFGYERNAYSQMSSDDSIRRYLLLIDAVTIEWKEGALFEEIGAFEVLLDSISILLAQKPDRSGFDL